ncbi:TPA: hypothetical protein I0I20_RS13190, partial [Enterococcus faecium]
KKRNLDTNKTYTLILIIKKGTNYMEWLNLEKIEKTILLLREKEMDSSNQQCLEEQLAIAMEEINRNKQKGLKLLNSEENIMDIFFQLLEIEATVLSIVDTIIYSPLEKDLYFYLKQNKPFIYKDYFEMVSYYASEFSEFSFLARFYLVNVKNDNIF